MNDPRLLDWNRTTTSDEVATLEDTILRNAAAENASGNLYRQQRLAVPVGRPDYGTNGVPSGELWTNYFEMHVNPDVTLFAYGISVKSLPPEEVGKPSMKEENNSGSAAIGAFHNRDLPAPMGKKLKRIIQCWLQHSSVRRYISNAVTDYSQILILKNEIEEIEKVNNIDPLPYRAENEDDPKPDAKRYEIRLQESNVATLKFSELLEYLQSPQGNKTYETKSPMVQNLDIVLGHARKTAPDRITFGRGQCFLLESKDKRQLGRGLIGMRGFFSSVRLATHRNLLNCNVCHGAFYSAVNLVKLFKDARITDQSSKSNKEEFGKFIKGLRVEIDHLPEKRNKNDQLIPRIRTIFGLAHANKAVGKVRVERFGAGPNDVFFLHENEATEPGSAANYAEGISARARVQEKSSSKSSTSLPSGRGSYISVTKY